MLNKDAKTVVKCGSLEPENKDVSLEIYPKKKQRGWFKCSITFPSFSKRHLK
jgi:hypothetical protein